MPDRSPGNPALSLEPETYVVLDLGGPAAAAVAAVRARFGYGGAAALPVECTVLGSSGAGPLDPDQDATEAYARLEEVATTTPAFEARFSSPLRFPGTDVFVLTVADDAPLRDLHERLARDGPRCLPSPFPFTPHVTLLQGRPVAGGEADELLATVVDVPFRCEMLSTYVADELPLRLLHRAYLHGGTTGTAGAGCAR